jgi:hypothetical protein
MLVQWTRSDNQLTGSLQQALLQGQAPSETVQSQNVAFTGTIQDQSVTLSLQQGLGTVTNLTGSLSGDQLNLSYPGQNGTVITLDMAPGTADDFNQTSQAFKTTPNRSTPTRSRRPRRSSARRRFSATPRTLPVTSRHSTMQSRTLEAPAHSRATCSKCRRTSAKRSPTNKRCWRGRADRFRHALRRREHGRGRRQHGSRRPVDHPGDQSSAGADQNNFSQQISTLKQAAQSLDADRQSDPQDVPANAPTDDQINATIDAANGKGAGETSSGDSAISQAQAMVSTANGHANKAQAACDPPAARRTCPKVTLRRPSVPMSDQHH